MTTHALSRVGDRRDTATQGEQLTGQVANSSGAYVYPIDDLGRLDRFLILGTEGGSYYAGERELTLENVACLDRLFADDVTGPDVVKRIVEISLAGRAAKNEPALFALAMASAKGGPSTRALAFSYLSTVARTGTHLFQFVGFREQFAGWGRGMKRAVADWYLDKSGRNLQFQLAKYRQRGGWSHRDLLRLSHPKARTPEQIGSFAWACGTGEGLPPYTPILCAHNKIHSSECSESQVLEQITEHRLGLEFVPPERRTKAVYRVALRSMGITALIRNLGKITSLGLLEDGEFDNEQLVVGRLTDLKALRDGRVHPLSVLVATATYASGSGVRGGLSWSPNPRVLEALEKAFYLAFGAVKPAGKKTMIGLDVSGSMGCPISGMPLTCRDAAAALAMVTYRTEPMCFVKAFAHELTDFPIGKDQALRDVIRQMNQMDFGYTDCAAPIEWARRNQKQVETFIVLTDSETNSYMSTHPGTALDRYRRESGIDAKLVVVGMVSNGFTIANPADGGMLDIVGFDTATPQAISEFSAL